MPKLSQITLFWTGFIGLTLLASAMFPPQAAGANAAPTTVPQLTATVTQAVQTYRLYLSGVSVQAVTLTGTVTIEGGACCIAGVAGEPLNIDVEFFSPGATHMRVRQAGVCFDAASMGQAAWETFAAQKTYVFIPAINWVGYYVSVQYQNPLGHLSPVYCDDIGVEGMPPNPTSLTPTQVPCGLAAHQQTGVVNSGPRLLTDTPVPLPITATPITPCPPTATSTYPPPCPLVNGSATPLCTQPPPTPCGVTPTPSAIAANGVLTTQPPPQLTYTPTPCHATPTATHTAVHCEPTPTPPPHGTPITPAQPPFCTATPTLTPTLTETPVVCPPTHTPTPWGTATPTPGAPPTSTPVAAGYGPLLTATPTPASNPCEPTPTPTAVGCSPTPTPVVPPTATPVLRMSGYRSQRMVATDPCFPPPTETPVVPPTNPPPTDTPVWHPPTPTAVTP